MNTQVSQFPTTYATFVKMVPFNSINEPYIFPLLRGTQLATVQRKFADHNLPGVIVILTTDGKTYTL